MLWRTGKIIIYIEYARLTEGCAPSLISTGYASLNATSMIARMEHLKVFERFSDAYYSQERLKENAEVEAEVSTQDWFCLWSL